MVQEIATYDRRMLAEAKPPGMDGSIVQNLGRRATCIVLWGVAAGDDARGFLDQLEQRFRAGAALPFIADIVADAEIQNVLIDNLRLQELAGKTDRFAYVVTLREHMEPAEPADLSPIDTSLGDEALDALDGLVNGLDAALAFASGLERFVPLLGDFLQRVEKARQSVNP